MEELIKEQRRTNELLEKLLNKEEKPKIKMLYIKDVAKIMGMNQSDASKLWDRPDFPGIKGIGRDKVEETAFYNWLQEKRENREF